MAWISLGLIENHILQPIKILAPDRLTIDKMLTLCIMPLRPVVARPALPEHEVVGPEDRPERPGPDAVHGAGLQVHQHGARHELAAGDELLAAGLGLGGQAHGLVVVDLVEVA